MKHGFYQAFLIITVFLSGIPLHGQESSPDMYFYADVMINASNAQHRKFAADEFHKSFIETLRDSASLNMSFDSLKWVSKVAPEDGAFRLFSWQLKEDKDNFKYFAVLQKADGSIIEFKDTRPVLNGFELREFDHNTWYGALYYGVFPFKYKKQTAYILLGYNGHNSVTNQKYADVLLLEGDKAVLGAPVFVKKLEKDEERRNRIMIEYADAAAGRIQFDREKKMIVFDHLITIFAEGPGQGAVPVPDGSYEAYELKGKEWVYIEKVFNQVMDKPPREQPVLEGREGKDLFGRKKQDK